MDSLSAKDLANKKVEGVTLPAPYDKLFGEIELTAIGLLWGVNHSGKSTFGLGLANTLAEYGRVEYIPSEEHFGKTLIDRVNRLKAYHENLHFSSYDSLDSLKKWLKDVKAKIVFLDSISVLDENDHQVVKFAQWCRENQIGMWMVSHANKDGTKKGSSKLEHEADIIIEVLREQGIAQAEKNRFLGELRSIPVPFEYKDIKKHRKGRKKKSSKSKESKPDFDSTMNEVEQMMQAV